MKAQIDLKTIIPQQPPIVMVDHMLDWRSDEFSSSLKVSGENIFVDGNKLLNYSLIEAIGQTAAAGIKLSSTKQIEATDGVLGAVTSLRCYDQARVQDEVITKVKLLASIGRLFKVKGECFVNQKKIFECELNLSAL